MCTFPRLFSLLTFPRLFSLLTFLRLFSLLTLLVCVTLTRSDLSLPPLLYFYHLTCRLSVCFMFYFLTNFILYLSTFTLITLHIYLLTHIFHSILFYFHAKLLLLSIYSVYMTHTCSGRVANKERYEGEGPTLFI